jgi:hypothetical protein
VSTKKNPFLWNALVILTIAVGGTAAVLVAGKEKYFPSLYGHRHAAVHAVRDSVVVHDDTVSTAVRESGSEIEEQTATESVTAMRMGEAPGSGEYVLVAGSFLTQQYAEMFQNRIREQVEGVFPELLPLTIEGSTYYRVVVQHSGSWQPISDLKNKLIAEGFSAPWVYRAP